jgi:hypothetical protein
MTVTDDGDRQPDRPLTGDTQPSGDTAGQSGAAEPGEWVTLSEAIARLRVSERTLRRRLAVGHLQKRLRPDGRLEVWVPPATGSGATRDSDRRGVENDQLERGIVLVERFNLAVHDQVAPILGQLEAANQRVADLARENGYLQAKVDELEQRLTLAGQSMATDTPPPPLKHPWWRFWQG